MNKFVFRPELIIKQKTLCNQIITKKPITTFVITEETNCRKNTCTKAMNAIIQFQHRDSICITT